MLLLFLATRYGQRCSLESIALRAHATLWSLLYHELTLIIKKCYHTFIYGQKKTIHGQAEQGHVMSDFW